MYDHFCYLMRVRYSECDPQNVVFNARYGDYVDLAAGEYMRAILGDYKDLLAQGIDNQVVSYSIDWKASARFDDVLAVLVRPDKLGNTSFSYAIDIINHETRQLLATAKVVYVMVSPKEHKPMPIPDFIREKYATSGAGIVADYSGAMTGFTHS